VNHPVSAPAPITVLDYIQAIWLAAGSGDRTADPHEPLSHCQTCQVPLTVSSAYPARFGTVRCGQCIGDDGFATAQALENFRVTGTLPCSGCGHPIQSARTSPDDTSRIYIYHCPACGTTARYTMPTVA
jgi:hypothetical protein